MLATAIIVFREVLEASLVVGIVLAASQGVPRRGIWVTGGVAAGVLGASLVAVCAGAIAAAVNGIGQELFNATILFTAVAMLGWHNIWMNRHGRELASAAATLGKAVVGGQPAALCAGVWSSASRCCAKARRSCFFCTASQSAQGRAGSACWRAEFSALPAGWRSAR